MKQILLWVLVAGYIQQISGQEFDYEGFGMEVTAETAPQGLPVGISAPDFSGTDQYGNDLTLGKMLEDGNVVLIFYRGDWCPVCTRYLKRFQDSLPFIVDAGARVVAVTPETNNNVQETIKKTDAKFHILSDLDRSIMDAYGVSYRVTDAYNKRIEQGKGESIEANNGADEPFLPVPATYIIDQAGTIVFRQFDPNYRKRASISAILSALEEVGK